MDPEEDSIDRRTGIFFLDFFDFLLYYKYFSYFIYLVIVLLSYLASVYKGQHANLI